METVKQLQDLRDIFNDKSFSVPWAWVMTRWIAIYEQGNTITVTWTSNPDGTHHNQDAAGYKISFDKKMGTIKRVEDYHYDRRCKQYFTKDLSADLGAKNMAVNAVEKSIAKAHEKYVL